MNTATALSCQTGGRGNWVRVMLPLLAAVILCVGETSRGASADPPAWQSELDSLRLSDATIALLPATRTAEAAEADRRLGGLFRQLVAKYPREAPVRKAAGDHFWRTGEVALATAEWEAAQSLDPTDAETASALGSARLRDGEVRLACEQFQRAAAARPEVARYHFELGNVLYMFRHQLTGLPSLPDEPAVLGEALAQLRAARDRAPGNVEFARAYAETFYGVPSPDWHEALDAWDHVRTLSAGAPDFALSHLARVSLRLGRPDQAEGYLEMIQDSRFAPAQAALRRQASELRQRKKAAGEP